MSSSLAPAPTARTAFRYIRRPAVTTDEDLRYDVSDRIAEISLARAPVNALSLSLLEQLIAALRRAAADENVRAVVLTSAVPRRFSAGLDLRLMLGTSATDVRRLLEALRGIGRCTIQSRQAVD